MRKRSAAAVIGRGLAAALGLLLALVLYVAAVMVEPKSLTSADDGSQPVLAAQEQQVLTDIGRLPELIAASPVKVLAANSRAGLTLEQAGSYSAPYEDDYGRVTRLVYRTEDGIRVQADSIYPARALALMDGDGFALTGSASVRVGGAWAVRMDSDTQIRLHAVTSEGLYVVTLPKTAEDRLSELVGSLQLQ